MSGKLQIHRIGPDNAFNLISTLTLTEEPDRMIFQGRYCYAAGNGSQNLTLIDVGDPYNPVEVALIDVGIVIHGLHAQGRFVYAAGVGGVKLVDVSVPGLPIVRGFAT